MFTKYFFYALVQFSKILFVKFDISKQKKPNSKQNNKIESKVWEMLQKSTESN